MVILQILQDTGLRGSAHGIALEAAAVIDRLAAAAPARTVGDAAAAAGGVLGGEARKVGGGDAAAHGAGVDAVLGVGWRGRVREAWVCAGCCCGSHAQEQDNPECRVS